MHQLSAIIFYLFEYFRSASESSVMFKGLCLIMCMRVLEGDVREGSDGFAVVHACSIPFL